MHPQPGPEPKTVPNQSLPMSGKYIVISNWEEYWYNNISKTLVFKLKSKQHRRASSACLELLQPSAKCQPLERKIEF